MSQVLQDLKKAIFDGDESAASQAAKALVEVKESTILAINAMASVMQELGHKFECQEVYLPELILSGDAMQAALKVLEPELLKSKDQVEKKGTVVIGTVKGDVHSLGKDIVGTLLKTAGFDVIDLGVDTPPSKFIEEARKANASIIAASALMTTTLPAQKELIEF